MDNKLPNPHKREIEPKVVEEINSKTSQYRVVRVQGIFIVQKSTQTGIWLTAYDELYQKECRYQTLRQAEDFIVIDRKPEIHYYY